MTVLPNAPIDAATGLPVPTIAVATGGGISVIRDDGTVTDSATAINFTHISANEDGFAYGYGVFENYVVVSYENTATDGWSPDIANIYYGGSGGMSPLATAHNSTNATDALAAYSQGNNIGLTNWDIKRGGGAYEKLFNYTTSTYNTGWMNGDIKLATLSDTDDTDVVGSELVTNGTFDTDTTGWTQAYVSVAPTTFSSVSGQLVARRGDQYRFCLQQLTVEVGKTYTVSVDSPTGDNLMVGKDSNSNQYGFIQTGAAGTGSVTFTATQTALYIMCHTYKNQTTDTIFDNISVRLAEEDRSVNGNGLQVFGTVTKNPVASGADLVAYSGFSSGNYLRQPYNSDLDFGTGDFSVTFWFNGSGAGNTNLWERGAATGQNFGILTVNGYIYLTGFGANIPIGSPHANAGDASWGHVVLLREAGVWGAYLNGEPVAWAYTNAATLTNTAAVLHLGGNVALTSFANTKKLALMRFSATVPTAAQVAKIYNDEKHLFQENAQATLYGDSDAVTALAYDDSTNLLHVGTSAGRSVFQGLRRVDNTTTAVGAAISASNGLVADE
jgi:hypothetical protein